jgi:hypothetical protein
MFAGVEKDTPIILFCTDSSFANFSFNFACAYEHFEHEDVRARTLWVATDSSSYDYLLKHGFNVLWGEEHYGMVPDATHAWKTKVYRQASKAVAVAAKNDLMQLGYHVIFNDADVVWLKDPSHFLLYDPMCRDVDVMMQLAPRIDAQGPGNSGFVFLRNNARTRVFMQTFANAIELMFIFDDQVILIAVSLLSTVGTLLLHCCHTPARLLSHGYSFVTLFVHC